MLVMIAVSAVLIVAGYQFEQAQQEDAKVSAKGTQRESELLFHSTFGPTLLQTEEQNHNDNQTGNQR